MQTFSELKKAGFTGLSAELVKDFQYLEQLASSTQANISDWPIEGLFKGIKSGDKRAINKIFFERTKEIKIESVTVDEQAFTTVIAAHEARVKNSIAAQIRDYRDNATYFRSQASEFANHMHIKLKESLNAMLQADALEGKNHTETMKREFRKIFESLFWEYNAEDNPESTLKLGYLTFRTRQNIILTEKNPAAGIDRRIDFGRYKVTLSTAEAVIRVYRFEHNPVTNHYYHPYVDVAGKICWGNAAGAAGVHLTTGKWSEAMSLLASLLSTYSPETTPWHRLADFEKGITDRLAAGQPSHFNAPESPVCEHCDEPEDDCTCSRCDTCEELSDDCECHYCEACDETYRDGDGCGGYWCERCESCTGSERCDEHWCHVCDRYSVSENDDGEAECDRGCCTYCDQRSDDCERCRECNSHSGHTEGCSNAPQPVTEETREGDPF